MGLLEGKVAIITGAGNGLGAAYARAFGAEGAKVLVNDLGGARDGSGGSIGPAQKVVDDIIAAGGEAVANGNDVSTMEGGQAIFDQAIKEWGKVDILVNNAGILRDETFHKGSEENWDLVMKVHLKGTYCCTKPVFQFMRDNGGGTIVNTSSTSGLLGNFGQSNYGAAKGGIYGLTRVLAIEGRKYGIKAMCMSPSALTRMTEDLPKYRELMESDDGFPVAGQPDTIAQSMVYMCSDLCGMDKSGKVMHVGRPGIAELKVMRSGGWAPDYAYTAQDIADREDQIFFPDDD
jgi:NAD(P)-dependent dehydrogenase (short-subunit alcohol dehydrogenase family)